MASDSEASFTSAKRTPIKRLPFVAKRRHVYIQLLFLFISVKIVTIALAHFAVALVSVNNVAGDLILNPRSSLNVVDYYMKAFLKPLIRWDAVHFFAIARDGYIFENQFAFFPLFPLLCRWIGWLFSLGGYLSVESGIGMAAFMISNASHFVSAIILHKMTLSLFKSSSFAVVSAVLFICNPASIQLSTMYSESTFALLCFAGLYQFFLQQHFIASICFALASSTRSNGLVMSGFFIYNFLAESAKDSLSLNTIKRLFLTVLYCATSVSGFVAFQVFAYYKFCSSDFSRPWCDSAVPNIYSFVQQHYWNVGLFRYFTVSQIPNFLFALPMLTVCSAAIYSYHNVNRSRFWTLGLVKRPNRKTRKLDLFLSDSLLPHIYLLIFMLFYNVFIAHVQIITRMFTFMPVVYWYMAYLMLTKSLRIQKSLQTYIALYGLIGACLFALNQPPA